MSEHKIRVPFLVLTVERKVKFLAWARKGFRFTVRRESSAPGTCLTSSPDLTQKQSAAQSALSVSKESKPHPFSRVAIEPGYCQVCLVQIVDGACNCGTHNEIRYGARHRPGDDAIEGEYAVPKLKPRE